MSRYPFDPSVQRVTFTDWNSIQMGKTIENKRAKWGSKTYFYADKDSQGFVILNIFQRLLRSLHIMYRNTLRDRVAVQLMVNYAGVTLSPDKRGFRQNIQAILQQPLPRKAPSGIQGNRENIGKDLDLESLKKTVTTKEQANQPAKNGRSLLNEAVVANKKDIVEYLLSLGANPDGAIGIETDKWTSSLCLIFIDTDDRKELLEMLLDANANANFTSIIGYTPLIFACVSGDLDLAKRLVARGADVNLNPNLTLEIPSGAALIRVVSLRKSNYEEMTKWLVNEAKADLSLKDIKGKTAYDWAVEKGSSNEIQTLLKPE